MAGIKELRLRIKALKNTSKITAAMKMVSAAKLKRAQDAYTRAKPYAERMEETLSRVLSALESPEHPLLQVREVKRTRYVVVSSDRGLAGAFNNGLLRAFARTIIAPPSDSPQRGESADDSAIEALGVGRRARDYVARTESLQAAGFEAVNTPTWTNAVAIANALMADFLDGKVDKVVLVYNRFNSVISQTPVFVPLLPLTPSPLPRASTAGEGKGSPKAGDGVRDSYIFEPAEQVLLADLLPRLVTLQVFRSLLENAVGEHSARMTAMDNATKNTKDLISSMSLTMNRARQAAITRELIEIVSGAEALNG